MSKEMLEKLKNVKKVEEEKLKEYNDTIEIDDVIYLGQATLKQEIDGKKVEEIINVYAVLEGDTIKYYSDNMWLGTETKNVGNSEPGIIPSFEYAKTYEEGNPIKDVIEKFKKQAREEKENPKKDKEEKNVSLKELESEEQKKEYAELLNENEEDIKHVSEINKPKNSKETEKINSLQEIDDNTMVNEYKDMEKALGLQGVRKFVIVYSEDAAKLSESGERNSSRYSMIAIMDDGSKVNLSEKLEEVRSEGTNSVEERIQTDADEKTRLENNPASMYRVKGTGQVFSFENGEYGEIKAYYGEMTKTQGSKFVGTQLETNNIWATSREVRDQASDRKGQYYADDKNKEATKHFNEHGDEELAIEDSDGELSTVACKNPYVPDTQITWEQFSKSSGNKDIKELQKEFFKQYDGKNGQKLILTMIEANNGVKEKNTTYGTFGEDDDGAGGTKGTTIFRDGPWNSAKH